MPPATGHTPDTIAAISTPPGRGGIGIVRLSGPNSLAIAQTLIRTSSPLTHAHARLAQVLDPTGVVLDQALVTAFLAPHSYTGEDLVEIAAHGSPVVLDTLLRAAIAAGARLAAPGEFTQRAFLTGRLDLTQAEAVHDLIAAQTLDQARSAAQQLGGALSRRIAPAKETLLHLIALLEAGMDFASGELDDVDIVPPTQIAAAIAAAIAPLQALAATFRRGQLLREGASIALIGPPNAGKSSLFNRLLDRDRAIVTPLPGTTRDTLEESLALNGIPLRLIDTAGLRSDSPAIDAAEQQGIARSREALADADIVLLIHDITQPPTPTPPNLENRPHLHVFNKIDLLPSGTVPGIAAPPAFPEPSAPPAFPEPSAPSAYPEPSAAPAYPEPSAPSAYPEPSAAPAYPEPSAAPAYPEPSAAPAYPEASASGLMAPYDPGFSPQGMPSSIQPPIQTSALTGQGLDTLRLAILTQLGATGTDTAALNTLRQHESVTAALTALAAAAAANAATQPHEIILLDLHTALRALDSLTGNTTPDDILHRIFSTFCIGK
jgi:tRNA modification GTPase